MCPVCEFKLLFHTTLIMCLIFSQDQNSKDILKFVNTKFDVSPHYHEPCITTHYKFTLGTFTCHVCWSVWFLFNIFSILIALFFFLTIYSHSHLHGEFLLVPVTVYLIYGLLSEGIQSICQIWHKRQAGDQS